MRLRKIRVALLGINGICYRAHVVILQSIFWYVFFGLTADQWRWKWAISSSVIWNVFNTLLYYNWHDWFARMFRIGREEGTK